MEEGRDTQVVRGVLPDGLVFHPKPALVKVRRARLVVGVGGMTRFIIHNNSAKNLRRALMERVYNVEVNGELQPPPQPVPGIFGTLQALGEILRHRVGVITPMSREQFVASRPAEKRKVYIAGLQSLYCQPVSRRDARVDGAFVKCEKINVSKKGDPAPRIIQPRTVRYNIEVGRYLAPVEHAIYMALDKMWGGETVMKGYNADQIGQHIQGAWSQFDDPVALGLDASRFDQHVSVEALQFEHGIYNGIFGSDELAELLTWQLRNEGVARADDGTFVYVKDGSRMSGDMNTALGNIILMVLMVLRFVQQRGVRARLINNGDDCTLIFERADLGRVLDDLHGWFLNYGFNIVQEPVAYRIEEIEFCQMHPVWVAGQYRMVRNLGPTLSKDTLAIRARTDKELRQWMWCVGKCGLAMAAGVPIQQAYYEVYVRSGEKGGRLNRLEGRSGLTWFSAGMTAARLDVSPETRVSFWKAFGVDPHTQETWENELEQTIIPHNAPQAENKTSIYL